MMTHATVFMVIVIVFLLVLGLSAIQGAITKLEDESSVLKRCKETLMPELQKRRNAGTEKDGYEILKSYDRGYTFGFERIINSKLAGKADGLCYVAERLDAIISAVNKTNQVRMAPPLTDLHNLTMQSEQGGKRVALFRAITPSVLVLGIGGTLWGVHDVLLHSDAMNQLADALIPGGAAVLVTIILIIFRGRYNNRLSSFIKDLDNYTITDLLPFFQPPDTLVEVADRFVSSLRATFTDEVQKDLGGVVKELKRYSEFFVSQRALYVGIINGACNNVNGLTEAAEQMAFCQESMTELFRETEKRLQRLLNLANRYTQDVEEGMATRTPSLNQLMANCSLFCTHLTKNAHALQQWEAVHGMYEKIKRVPFEKAGESIRESSAQFSLHADYLKEMRGKLSEYLQMSQDARSLSDTLRQNANYTQNKLSELPETGGLLDNHAQIEDQKKKLLGEKDRLYQSAGTIKDSITTKQSRNNSTVEKSTLRDRLDRIRFFPFSKYPVGIILSLLIAILYILKFT